MDRQRPSVHYAPVLWGGGKTMLITKVQGPQTKLNINSATLYETLSIWKAK